MDHPEGQMMCGIKDGYSVHYPCRHCMAHKDEMGNVVTNSEGIKVIKRYELRKDRFLDSAKEFSVASKPQTSLGFVLDKSREIFDKIPWKYPFQIYCMTPMCAYCTYFFLTVLPSMPFSGLKKYIMLFY